MPSAQASAASKYRHSPNSTGGLYSTFGHLKCTPWHVIPDLCTPSHFVTIHLVATGHPSLTSVFGGNTILGLLFSLCTILMEFVALLFSFSCSRCIYFLMGSKSDTRWDILASSAVTLNEWWGNWTLLALVVISQLVGIDWFLFLPHPTPIIIVMCNLGFPFSTIKSNWKLKIKRLHWFPGNQWN